MSYSDDGADWDELADRGRPALATAIAAAVLLIVTLTGRYAAGWQEGTAYRLGYAAAGAPAIWLVAYLVTLRKARPLWKAGSLAALLAVALAAGALRLSRPEAAVVRDDAREAARQMQQVLARPDQPPARVEAGRGPVSQMTAAALNGALADRSAFEAEAEAAGLNQLLGDAPITHSSPVLARCEALVVLAVRARDLGDRWQVHQGAARRIGEAAVRDGRLPASFVEGFVAGSERDSIHYRRMWTLTANVVDAAVPLCQVLARRRWTLERNQFLFGNDTDLRDYNRHLGRVRMLSAQLERLQREARVRARARIDRMAR